MSFFGKLFGKKEQPQAPQEPEVKMIDTPWGKLYYYGDKYNAFNYEGYVEWYEGTDIETDMTIECDTDGVDDITRGYEKFLYIMERREDIDYQVKMTALEHFADESGMIVSSRKNMPMSKELFLDTMPIRCITIKRDGCIDFFIMDNDIRNAEGRNVHNISVIYTDKNTFEVIEDPIN